MSSLIAALLRDNYPSFELYVVRVCKWTDDVD